jgi:hypothetical protein
LKRGNEKAVAMPNSAIATATSTSEKPVCRDGNAATNVLCILDASAVRRGAKAHAGGGVRRFTMKFLHYALDLPRGIAGKD